MSIRLKIIGTLALIIPVMVIFLTLFHIAQKKNEEQRVKIEHSYQVIDQIRVLLSDMQDAETGKRGYMITNDKSFLEPYNWSIQKVDADLSQLHKLTQANASQQQHLNEFEPVMRKALSYMAETIAIAEKQGLEAAAKRVASKAGKTLMDRMRAILGNMANEERRSAMEQEKAYNRAHAGLYKGEAVFIVSMGLITIIIGWLLIRSITWPLRELRKGAGKLGAGKYATRLKFTYQDEFNELAIAFNQMAEAIQARTQELNNIVKTMVNGLIIIDTEGNIRSLNPAAERMFEVTAEALVGKHLTQLLPQMVDDIERHDLAGEKSYRCEINGQRKDGSLFPLELTLSEMSVNEAFLFTCLLRDLSEQKNAQLALVNNEARLHAIIETVIEGIITIDSKGTVETMNPAAEKIFAYQANEVIGRNINMLMPEPYHSQHDGYLLHFLATGQAKVIGIGREVVGRRKDGSVFPMELAVSEMSIDGRRMFTGLVRDITERKQTEDSLARLQRLHKQVFNSVGDGLHGIDMDGRIIFENPAAATMLGWNPDELIGQPSHSVMHHSHANGTPYPPDQCPIYAVRHDGITRHIQDEVFWRKDGTSFPVAYTCTPMRNDAGDIVGTVVAFRDISQLKAAENQLHDNAARIHAILDTVVDGIITINERGIVETINPAAENIFGYTFDEVIGNNINMLMPEPYHSQHDGYLLHYLTTAQARVIGIGREVIGRRKDGSVFPMDLAVSEMSIDGRRMFTGLVRDISERKAMEQMKNEFISTVSHELRTPLTSIQGSLGLILGGATGDLPEKSTKLLTIASNNCKRLVRLINDILDLEKFESGKMAFDIKPIEIMPLIQQAVDSNQAYAHEFGVTFAITHEQPGTVILADNDRLTQVLTNLLSNAAKFSHRGGQVDVAITIIGRRLRVSVTDFGAGIQEAFRDRIFKKFTQEDGTNTRQKGGTGLGLSISKAIIEQMGGAIDYESEPGKKTTFFFELPLYRDDKAPLANLSDERHKEHLLILEDDRDVANLLRMMLAKHGYAADIANNAEQAKQMLSSKHYDALTLDLMLPGQSGIDFFRELHTQECFKQLPVIVVSMLVDQGKHELNGGAVNIVDWLSKPIDEDRLEQAVNLALRRNGATTRILHVEDDPDIVHIVGTLLQNTALVDVAMNLAAAREKLQQDYDLVILDMGLPDGSGETLLPLLANRDKAIPVVIFSASEIETADNQQVLASLIKSKTSNEELMNKIETILKNRRR